MRRSLLAAALALGLTLAAGGRTTRLTRTPGMEGGLDLEQAPGDR